MRSVSVRLSDLDKITIPIGFVGENLYTSVNIDCKEVFDKHPSAIPSMSVTPPKGDSYPAVTTRDGDIVTWVICDSDLIYKGTGEIQLAFTVDGEMIGKSYPANTRILRSIEPSGTTPTPVANWLVAANTALNEIPQDIADGIDEFMSALVGVGQTLQPNENVTVSFDVETKTLTIGVPKGEKGDPGQDGRDGQDGQDGYSPTATVSKSGDTVTITITDKNGTTTATVKDGKDGEDGDDGFSPIATVSKNGKVVTISVTDKNGTTTATVSDGESAADIIDDNAGSGDTGKVWSADKTYTENQNLLSALNDLAGLETTWSNGFWNKNTKTFNTDSNYQHTDYIPINEVNIPIHYIIKAVNTVASYILFDEEKAYISKHNTSSSSLVEIDDVVTDFEGAAYIVFETYVGYGYTAKLTYCNISDAKISGYMKDGTEIPQKQLTFSELIKPVNMFDYKSSDMCKPGYMYYSTTIGSTVTATTSGNTVHYVAIKIPVYDMTKLTFGIYPNTLTKPVYWVGAVDADMKLIAYSIVNQNAPVTYNLPEGTVYFLASYSLGSARFDKYLPRVMAVNANTITHYSSYFAPYYYLHDCKTETEENDDGNVKLKLPSEYSLVVGDTFQLFYKGIINASKPEIYDVLVDCSKGNAYERFFEFTPTEEGNVNATVTLYDFEHKKIDEQTVTLKVYPKATSPGTQKNVLCVGDSLTTGGTWVWELNRRLTGTGSTPAGDGLTNINFIGTRVANNVHYEGYGGWTLNSYNTENVSFNSRIITCTHDKTEAQDQHSIYKDGNNVQWKLETILDGQIKIIAVSGEGREFPNTGTLTWVSGGVNHSNIVYTAQEMAAGNPFWNSNTEKVDFANYASELGVSSIDFVYVLIGWNSASWNEADYKAAAETFVDNVHDSFPNAKVIFIGLQIPARDGLGVNYGATGIYSNYYGLMQYVFNLDSWYKDVADNNTNVYNINLSGQFDTEYNMPTSTRQVNSRNNETETYQSNGVHPASSGYYQIADAAYRDIIMRLQ